MNCIFPECPAAGRIRQAVCDRFCNHPDIGNGRTVSRGVCFQCRFAGQPIPPQRPKVGDVLADLIRKRYGQSATSDCDCTSRISQMNAWGPDDCEANLETIVGWLIAAAADVGDVRSLAPDWAKRWKLRPFVRKAIKIVREWTPEG